MRWLPLLLAPVLVIGCAVLHDDVDRAQQTYQDARYQDTMTWLENLEDDVPDMDRPLRARYYYLRGMTSYRLGHRDDALHYLALAREEASQSGQGLEPDQRKQMDHALAELTPEQATFHARGEEGDDAKTAGDESAAGDESTAGGESAGVEDDAQPAEGE